MNIAVYPGTFDPITNGHIDIISRTARMFDRVVVAVAINSAKKTLFSEEDRLSLARRALAEYPNVDVDSCHGLIVEYAGSIGATAIVRGLRAISDFEYELQMALMNRRLREEVSTIFMMPHERYTYLNSTIIRELWSYNADVSEFVPACVVEALRDRRRE